RQLMLAVLADAVRSYVGNRGARDHESRALFRETLAWFKSADRTTLFAFESVCDALDIEPDYVRRMLVVENLNRRRRPPRPTPPEALGPPAPAPRAPRPASRDHRATAGR